MPNLTAGERELLISGTCEECFNKMFADDESEDKETDEEFVDPKERARQYATERENLYKELEKKACGTSEVKEYKLFTEEEREAHQLVWEHHLQTYCRPDSFGCHPCDNGMPCDTCQYDSGLKLINAIDAERLGLPITPEYKELLDLNKTQLIKEGEAEQAKRAFYED